MLILAVFTLTGLSSVSAQSLPLCENIRTQLYRDISSALGPAAITVPAGSVDNVSIHLVGNGGDITLGSATPSNDTKRGSGYWDYTPATRFDASVTDSVYAEINHADPSLHCRTESVVMEKLVSQVMPYDIAVSPVVDIKSWEGSTNQKFDINAVVKKASNDRVYDVTNDETTVYEWKTTIGSIAGESKKATFNSGAKVGKGVITLKVTVPTADYGTFYLHIFKEVTIPIKVISSAKSVSKPSYTAPATSAATTKQIPNSMETKPASNILVSPYTWLAVAILGGGAATLWLLKVRKPTLFDKKPNETSPPTHIEPASDKKKSKK